jgi:tetratricopeptide (TPR) repeat protein
MHQSPPQNTNSLSPHKYPTWLIFFGFVLIILFYYSLFLLPQYIDATEKYQLGVECYTKKEYNGAIRNFEDALEIAPSSKTIKIAMAKAYFKSGNRDNCFKAIAYLKHIKIDNSEWSDLIAVMPVEYQQFLPPTKNR